MDEKLQNLNNLKGGLHKRWILKDKNDYSKVCDYLQKINYSIQDFNYEFKCNDTFQIKEIVFLIMLSVWIQEAVISLEKCYKEDVMKTFQYTKFEELRKAKKYIAAIRSFVVAHPLSTDRHEMYGFDGDLICVDIRTKGRYLLLEPDEMFSHLSHEGITKERCDTDDFYLYVYSKKEDAMQFFRFIGCSVEDIVTVARLYIDKIYALDQYLYKQKKKDYEHKMKTVDLKVITTE